MAECLILKGGGNPSGSDDCSATAAQVLKGTTAIVKGSNDAPVGGSMENKGAWNGSVAMNGKVTIPEGYHNGNGAVSGPAIDDRGAVSATLPINGTYTIPKGYHNGNGTVKQSITTKAAATYNTSGSDQTITANQYLSGAQTIKAVTTENISAANIKNGVTVKVGDANNAGRIKNVTGTCLGTYKSINANAYYGSGEEKNSFTMPADGVIVYGGMCFGGYNSATGTVICEVQVNGSVITDMNIPNSGNFWARTGTVNQTRKVKKGDVIAVRASTTKSNGCAQISCVCIY